MKHRKTVVTPCLAAWLVSGLVAANAAPVGDGFMFQGILKNSGVPANGEFDVRFYLFPDPVGGASNADPLVFDGTSGNRPPVGVTNGRFQVELDFGADPFDGAAIWLEVRVRRHGSGDSYQALTPRQAITAVPYALRTIGGPAGNGPWDSNGGNINNTNAGNVGIGTTTPESPLHVAGDIRSDGAFGIISHNPNNSEAVAVLGWLNDVARIRIGGNGVGAGGGLDIQKTGDRSLMRLYDSGDVWFRGGIESAGDVLTPGSLRSTSPSGEAEVFLGWGSDAAGAEMARIRIGGNSGGAYNGLEIQAVGNRSLLRITNGGGVGIGTSTPNSALSVEGDGYFTSNLGVGTRSPAARLHVSGGTDAALSGGGYVVMGPTSGQNLVMDNNEVMARNGTSPATLFINQDGGSVVVGGAVSYARLGVGTSLPTERIDLGGGNIKMGYELAYDLSVDSRLAFARCTGDRVVIGGGCECGSNAIEQSQPFEDSISHGWACRCGGTFASATAVCANMR